MFNHPGTKIQNSSFHSAFSSEDFLPEVILTREGELYKIRSKKKIICYPKYEENNQEKYCHQKVMLFYPLSEEVTETSRVMQLFNESSGVNGLTVVEKVER